MLAGDKIRMSGKAIHIRAGRRKNYARVMALIILMSSLSIYVPMLVDESIVSAEYTMNAASPKNQTVDVMRQPTCKIWVNGTGVQGDNITVNFYYRQQARQKNMSANWQYYKLCSVSNRIQGYQMKLKVGKSASGNVTCGGHCNDNFSDIRFYRTDNMTPLGFWRENYTSGRQATFWINNSYNDSRFLMYYGNAHVNTTSNGVDTFPIFDDFDGTSLNTSRWDVSGGFFAYSVSNSKLNITQIQDDHYPGLWGFKYKKNFPYQDNFNASLKRMTFRKSQYDVSDFNSGIVGILMSDDTEYNKPLSVLHDDTSGHTWPQKYANIDTHTYTGGTLSSGSMSNLTMTKRNGQAEAYWDGSLILGPYPTTTPIYSFRILVNNYLNEYGMSSGHYEIERVYVRMMRNSPPQWASFGTEGNPPNTHCFAWNFTQAENYNTRYYWNVSVNDGSTNVTYHYWFQTIQWPSIEVYTLPARGTKTTNTTLHGRVANITEYAMKNTNLSTPKDICLANNASWTISSEVLRPIGEKYVGIPDETGPGSLHWDKVDDVTPDDSATYVSNDNDYSGAYDLYELSNTSSTLTEQIVNVTMTVRCMKSYAGSDTYFYKYFSVNTHGTVYQLGWSGLTTTWANYTYGMSLNPYTNQRWNWTEIQDLQAGAYVHTGSGTSWSGCTQVYVTVYYSNYVSSSYIYTVGGQYLYKLWDSNLTVKSTYNTGKDMYAITQDADYIYAGGATSLQQVGQYWKSNMTRKGLTSDYGTTIRAIIQDGTYLYVGGNLNNIYRYWKNNLTFKDDSAVGTTIYAMAQDATYLYTVGNDAGSSKIFKFWKSNLTKKSESTAYGGDIYSIAIDGTYAYIGGATTNTVRKYWLSNLTYKAQTASYGSQINAISLDGIYLYVGGSGSPASVKQYWKTNLTYKKSVAYSADIDTVSNDDLFIYAGGTGTRLYQYWKSNLTFKSYSPPHAGEIRGNVIAPAGTESLLLVPDGNSVIKYSASNLSYLDANDNFSSPEGVCAYGHCFWVADTGNNRIMRFMVTGDVLIGTTSTYISEPRAICTDGTYIYVSCATSGLLVKFTLDLQFVTYVSSVSQVRGIATDGTFVWTTHYYSGYIYKWWASNLTYITRRANVIYMQKATYFNNMVVTTDYSNSIFNAWSPSLSGTYKWNIGTVGGGNTDDTYYHPYSIVMNSSFVWIADTGNHRIIKRYLLYASYTTHFEYGVVLPSGFQSGVPRFRFNTSSTSTTRGGHMSSNAASLNPGRLYFFRAVAAANGSTFYGKNVSFVTCPNPPTSVKVQTYNRTRINLTWTKGIGSTTSNITNTTVVIRKEGAPPASPYDGVMLYNGTDSSKADTNLKDGMTYYYAIWSWTRINYSLGSKNSFSLTYELKWNTTIADLLPRFSSSSRSPSTGIEVKTKFHFNVTYADEDDGKPVQIKTSIWLGTIIYNNSMTYKSGSNYSAALYSYNTTLPKAGIWSFKFQAFDGMHWNETGVMAFEVKFNITFSLSFPVYLNVGEYISVVGTIANKTHIPLNNVWVKTKVLNSTTNSVVNLSTMDFYVVNGLYMYQFCTSTMLTGVYTVCLNFTMDGVKMYLNSTLYLSYAGSSENPGPGRYPAYLYYTFFDQNTGMQLSDDLYKMYISSTTTFNEGNRVKYGRYATYMGQVLYYKIKDYWNNTVYPTNYSHSTVFISYAETYLDVGIPLNQFLVKNSNDSVCYFRLTNGPMNGTGNTWYARWVPPQESQQIFMRTGTYNFSLQYYDPITRALKKTVYMENFYIDQDLFYWISGYRLTDIVISLYNVNSSLLNQLINVGVYVNNFNSTIFNQQITESTWLQNLNTNIANQLIYMVQNISNWNTTIKNQWIAAIQNITNFRANITLQINSVDQHIINMHNEIFNQTNLIMQEILNLNVTIWSTQLNGVLQNITNVASNISTQANLMGQWISNLNSSLSSQMNVIKQEVENFNSTVFTQMNVISQQVDNFGTNVTYQLNLLSQEIINTNASINTQANVIEQLVDNTRANLLNQLNGVWDTVNNSEAKIQTQLSGVWTSVNNTNQSMTFNMSGFNLSQFRELDLNFTGFDSLMLKLREILNQFQMPHGWQIPQVDYSINDTTPPISTITAYVTINGKLQVDYSCSDNFVGVAYVDLYYKVGTNTTLWREWTMHTGKSGSKTFNGPENGTVYWFRCLGTDLSGNVETASDANTVNLTYHYAPVSSAVSTILPVDQTTLLYIMAFLLVCILLLTFYSFRKRKKEEKMLARRNQGPRQPLR
jgi:hypothetical protein